MDISVNSLSKIIFTFLVLLCSQSPSVAGGANKVKSINQEIHDIQSIIEENATTASGLANEISHLEYHTIAARKILRLIDKKREVSAVELAILNNQLFLLEQEKSLAIDRYQKIILEEYKNRNYKSKLYFLASSKNIREFVNRLSHLSTLKEFRKQQLIEIEDKRKEVEDKLSVYRGSDSQKAEILAEKTVQMMELNMLLRAKHKAYKNLEIENQTFEFRRRVKEENLSELSSKTITEGNGLLEQDINKSFRWPVNFGLIVGRFGTHKHSKERKVQVANNGIDILVSARQEVLCAADGVVKAVVNIPGRNTSVIVSHQGMFTVYSNLKNSDVKAGSAVNAGKRIGEVAINTDGFSKFHFEVWKGTQNVNPENYLLGSLE
jgi:murein DD-endopeptidase MepM/ murein hydrolase activator NlpD